MKRRLKVSNNRIFILVVALVGFIVGIHQQCSDVNLKPIAPSQTIATSHMRSTFLPPVRQPARLRLVVFVDQSYSMVQGKCPSDLDGDQPRPDQKADGCVPQPGIDPEMDRFSAIEEWFDDLEQLPNLDPDGIRVALIPFSGGKYKRPLANESPSLYEFMTIADARVRLAQLRKEQQREMELMSQESPFTKTPLEAVHMGTTAPKSTLDYMFPIIKKEMENLELESERRLSNEDGANEMPSFTPFRIIYISDGVFKPLKEHWDRALKFSGCDKNPNFTLCYDLKRDFHNEIGDVDENTFDNTVASFRAIYQLDQQFKYSNLDLNFVKIHPDRVSAEDQNSGKESATYRNLFNEIKSSLESGEKKIGLYSQFDGHHPFSIFGGPTIKTFKVDNFYVINLNRHVNDFGQVIVDSDGDGLSDDEELSFGTSPVEARTNHVCLDIITHFFGCKNVGCDPERDEDGDGLNSCEEITLSSSDQKIDSDGDGLLDSHEVLRKLSPIMDDRDRFASNSSVSNYDHFLRGVSIFSSLDSIVEGGMISFSIDELGFVTDHDSLGQEVQLAEYEAIINSIPLGETKSVEELPHFVNSLGVVRDPQFYLLGTSHSANKNQLVHIFHVRAIQDPADDYWLVFRNEMEWNGDVSVQSYQLDLSKFGLLQ